MTLYRDGGRGVDIHTAEEHYDDCGRLMRDRIIDVQMPKKVDQRCAQVRLGPGDKSRLIKGSLPLPPGPTPILPPIELDENEDYSF